MTFRRVYRPALLLLILAIAALAQAPENFRIEGPFDQANYNNVPVAPHLPPWGGPIPGNPILHWDLRELPECVFPYSYINGTPDLGGLAEFLEVDAAFSDI